MVKYVAEAKQKTNKKEVAIFLCYIDNFLTYLYIFFCPPDLRPIKAFFKYFLLNEDSNIQN